MKWNINIALTTLVRIAQAQGDAINIIPMNITALSSRGGYSVLECWQLSSIPVDAMQAANYAVGNTTVATWSKIEPRTHIGEAWAPHVQLSMILNGLIRITAPAPSTTGDSSTNSGTYDGGTGTGALEEDLLIQQQLPKIVAADESNNGNSDRPATQRAYIMPGTTKSSVLIAADLKSISTIAGHYTEFPSDESTILVQAPFVDNKVPEHIILHDGPCV